jgi:hypothetical protein
LREEAVAKPDSGTHSPWVSRLLQQLGDQAISANAREIRAITASRSETDPNDAEKLARFAYCDPRLRKPIQHCSWGRCPIPMVVKGLQAALAPGGARSNR